MKEYNQLLNVLIDIRYKYSMNKFEEIYGESVSYTRFEQDSYVDLKEFVIKKIGRKIKFRKYSREGMVLTVKAEMKESEYEQIIVFNKNDLFNFICNFIVSDIKLLKEEEDGDLH